MSFTTETIFRLPFFWYFSTMKKTLFLLGVYLCVVFAVYAQDTTQDTLPYLKYPTLPAFNVRLTDSETIFNTYNIEKGRAAMIILFSPDCSHCQAFFKKLLPAMDSFKNIDFYLVTLYSKMNVLRDFYKTEGFEKYSNIKVVGRDYEFFCPAFYGLTSIPDLMLYDKNKKLVKLIDHPKKIEDIYEVTHGL